MALLQHFQEPDSHMGVWWVYSSVEMNINWLDLVWGEREQGRYGGDTQIRSSNPTVCRAWFVAGCRLELRDGSCLDSFGCSFAHHRASTKQSLPQELEDMPQSWWGDVCGVWVPVLADMSVAGSLLRRYRESSWHGSWQKQCGSKASGCRSSFLLPQNSGRGTNFLGRPFLWACLGSSPESLA